MPSAYVSEDDCLLISMAGKVVVHDSGCIRNFPTLATHAVGRLSRDANRGSRRLAAKLITGLMLGLGLMSPVRAGSTIDPIHRYAYGANVGWIDWRGDTTNGAVLGEYVCSGYLYSANVGWINLGSGSPANQIRYQNLPGTDFGVNHDGAGNLSGYAYGANIGWIQFETNGAPKIDLLTGRLSGSVYGANVGWISLNNAYAFVQTDTLSPGILDVNGLPIAWELSNFGVTGIDPNADPDGDGMSNRQEYVAGSNPLAGASGLRITSIKYDLNHGTVGLTWTSVPTRCYYIEQLPDLNSSNWTDGGIGQIAPDPGATTSRIVFAAGPTQHFYRVRSVLPLSP
ncbi:MAG: hypothetical protein JWR26_2878 [Pedosphaera sp.]|nr:hypothetical protein [Pedosphaera sp.]